MPGSRRPSVEQAVREMTRRIVRRFAPERIILFGSQARGDAGSDSDVDLLVVMPVDGSLRAKRLELRALLRDVPVSKDVLVSTPEQFAWRKDVPGTIEHPAHLEGRVLYVRA